MPGRSSQTDPALVPFKMSYSGAPRRTTTAVPVMVTVTSPSVNDASNVHVIASAGTGAGLTSSNSNGSSPVAVITPVMRYGMNSWLVPTTNAGVNGASASGVTTVNSSRPGQFTVNSVPAVGAARAVGLPTSKVAAAAMAAHRMASRRLLINMLSPLGPGPRCQAGQHTESMTSR